MQDRIVERSQHQREREKIERREFKLLMALIHKLKSGAAVLNRI